MVLTMVGNIDKGSRIDGAPEEQRGFTLLEVVVALAILGTGLLVLLEVHRNSLQLLADAQDRVTMEILLTRVIGEAEQEVLAGNDSGEGDFGKRYPDYSYTYSATLINEDDLPGLLEVVVSVKSPSEERQMTVIVYDGTQVDTENTQNIQNKANKRNKS